MAGTSQAGKSLRARIGRWLAGWGWPLLGAAWVGTFGLGFVGFAIEACRASGGLGLGGFVIGACDVSSPPAGADTSWAQAPSTWVYYTLQLFLLESGAVVPNPNPVLDIARFVAPLVAAWTVLRSLAMMFGDQVRAYRLRRNRRHTIVCGLGEKGWHLARQLLERGDRVVVVERDPTSVHIAELLQRGGLIVAGDASDGATLARAGIANATSLIAVCGDDATNAGVAAQAMLAAPMSHGPALRVYAHVEDPALCTLLRAHELRIGGDARRARLGFFNIYDRAARHMLDLFPPFSPPRPSVLVVGLGPLGQRVTTELGRRWHAAVNQGAPQVRIVAIDTGAERTVAALLARTPLLGQVCQIDAIDAAVDDAALLEAIARVGEHGGNPFERVYLCLEDESRGLAAGLTLLRHLPGEGMLVVVAASTQGAGLARLVDGAYDPSSWSARLRVFGVLDRACTPALLLGDTIEVLARAIHERYVSLREATEAVDRRDPSLAPWESLDEGLRESNRAQAADTHARLRAIGYDVEPLDDWGWDGSDVQFDRRDVEDLARREHERFVAERRQAGWTYGPARDLEAKRSPALVDWEHLPDDEREKDYDTIRELPRFLARAGLRVRPSSRRPAEPPTERPS